MRRSVRCVAGRLPASTGPHAARQQQRLFETREKLYERAQLGFSDADWNAVKDLINSGVKEERAIRCIFEEKHSASMPRKGLAMSRFVGAGAKTSEEQTVVDRYRDVVQRVRHQLVSECWAFPETEVPIETCLDCSDEEARDAMAYLGNNTDDAIRRWETYCRLEPELAVLDADDEFQELYAQVYELRHELARPTGPDPMIFSPQEWEMAEMNLRKHPKQRRYLAHVVAFARRSALEKRRLAQLMAAKNTTDPAERKRLLLGEGFSVTTA